MWVPAPFLWWPLLAKIPFAHSYMCWPLLAKIPRPPISVLAPAGQDPPFRHICVGLCWPRYPPPTYLCWPLLAKTPLPTHTCVGPCWPLTRDPVATCGTLIALIVNLSNGKEVEGIS